MQCNAMQCNTIQYNTIQYNTIQYNTIQYNYNVYTGHPPITVVDVNPINPGLLAFELTLGGGVFQPPSITPLSLKLDCSNFAQSYFQIG